MALKHVAVVFETEAGAQRRLAAFGYPPEIAAEIAVYLAQSTDLPEYFEDIRSGLAGIGAAVEFIALDDLPARLPALAVRAEESLLWCLTDGIRFYRGSAVPALARLAGIARYGSPSAAQHLCQDKFATLCLASAAGAPVPPTLLLENGVEIARLGALEGSNGPFFVKPNTLGAKIGIFADSRCASICETFELSRRLHARYGDRAVAQPYLDGHDVRVSFMDIGLPLDDALGIEMLVKEKGGETGGDFLTMMDNETLSGAKDGSGARGAFGQERQAAFTPKMIDLRASADPAHRGAVQAIIHAVERVVRLTGLCDYFSFDFRMTANGDVTMLEFEVCPAVTIYDFQSYLANRHGKPLGEALALSMSRAFGRKNARMEA